MRGEPMIEVCCDKCDAVEMMGLCALAKGGYDERNLDAELERMGWVVGSGIDVCPDCQSDEDAEEE